MRSGEERVDYERGLGNAGLFSQTTLDDETKDYRDRKKYNGPCSNSFKENTQTFSSAKQKRTLLYIQSSCENTTVQYRNKITA